MPRLQRFSSTEIAMFFADHNPPHFHVLGKEGAAQVRIDTLEVIVSSGKIDLAEALAWAAENQAFSQRNGPSIAETDNEHRQADRHQGHGPDQLLHQMG
jgi:hypothetical protein